MGNGVEVIVRGGKPALVDFHDTPLLIPIRVKSTRPTTLPPYTVSRQFHLLKNPHNSVNIIGHLLHSIVRSASPDMMTKTMLTTFTYLTTMLKDSSTIVKSREDTISNVITQKFRPSIEQTPNLKSEPHTLPPDIFQSIKQGHSPYFTKTLTTTYTYFNTFSAGQTPIILSSKETVSNVVTVPAYMKTTLFSNIFGLTHSRVFETETYYTTFTFSKTLLKGSSKTKEIKTTKETVTQVVITEALLPTSSILTPMLTPLPITFDIEDLTKTYYTTYTHFVTQINKKGELEVETKTSVRSEIVTEKATLTPISSTRHDHYPGIINSITAFTTVPPSIYQPSYVPVKPLVELEQVLVQATKTYYTTYTYYTTILGKGTSPPKIISRTQVVSSVKTESLTTRLNPTYVNELKKSYLKKHSTILEVTSSVEEIKPTRINKPTPMKGTLVTQNIIYPHWPRDEERLTVEVEGTTVKDDLFDIHHEFEIVDEQDKVGTGNFEEVKDGINKIVGVLTNSKYTDYLLPSESYDFIQPSDAEALEQVTLKNPEDFDSAGSTENLIMGNTNGNNHLFHEPTPPLESESWTIFSRVNAKIPNEVSSTVLSRQETTSMIADIPSKIESENTFHNPDLSSRSIQVNQILNFDTLTTSILGKRKGTLLFQDLLTPSVYSELISPAVSSLYSYDFLSSLYSNDESEEDLWGDLESSTVTQNIYDISDTFDTYAYNILKMKEALKDKQNEPINSVSLLETTTNSPNQDSETIMTEVTETETTTPAVFNFVVTRKTTTKAPKRNKKKNPKRPWKKRPNLSKESSEQESDSSASDEKTEASYSFQEIDLTDELSTSLEDDTFTGGSSSSESDSSQEDFSLEDISGPGPPPHHSFPPNPPGPTPVQKVDDKVPAPPTGTSTGLTSPTGINWKPLLKLGAVGLGGLGASTLTKLGPLFNSVAGYMKGALVPIARNDSIPHIKEMYEYVEPPMNIMPPPDHFVKYNKGVHLPVSPSQSQRNHIRFEENDLSRIPAKSNMKEIFRPPPTRFQPVPIKEFNFHQPTPSRHTKPVRWPNNQRIPEFKDKSVRPTPFHRLKNPNNNYPSSPPKDWPAYKPFLPKPYKKLNVGIPTKVIPTLREPEAPMVQNFPPVPKFTSPHPVFIDQSFPPPSPSPGSHVVNNKKRISNRPNSADLIIQPHDSQESASFHVSEAPGRKRYNLPKKTYDEVDRFPNHNFQGSSLESKLQRPPNAHFPVPNMIFPNSPDSVYNNHKHFNNSYSFSTNGNHATKNVHHQGIHSATPSLKPHRIEEFTKKNPWHRRPPISERIPISNEQKDRRTNKIRNDLMRPHSEMSNNFRTPQLETKKKVEFNLPPKRKSTTPRYYEDEYYEYYYDDDLPEVPPAPVPPTKRPIPKLSSKSHFSESANSKKHQGHDMISHSKNQNRENNLYRQNYKPVKPPVIDHTTPKQRFESLLPPSSSRLPELVIEEIQPKTTRAPLRFHTHKPSKEKDQKKETSEIKAKQKNRAKISKIFIRRFRTTTPPSERFSVDSTTVTRPPVTTTSKPRRKFTMRPVNRFKNRNEQTSTRRTPTTTTTKAPTQKTVVESWLVNPTINDLLKFEKKFKNKYNIENAKSDLQKSKSRVTSTYMPHPNHRYDTSYESNKKISDEGDNYEDEYYYYDMNLTGNKSLIHNHRLPNRSHHHHQYKEPFDPHQYFTSVGDTSFGQFFSGSEDHEAIIDPTNEELIRYPYKKETLEYQESRRNFSSFKPRLPLTTLKPAVVRTTSTMSHFENEQFTHMPNSIPSENPLRATTYKPKLEDVLLSKNNFDEVKPTTFRGEAIFPTTYRPSNREPFLKSNSNPSPVTQAGSPSFYEDESAFNQIKMKNKEIYRINTDSKINMIRPNIQSNLTRNKYRIDQLHKVKNRPVETVKVFKPHQPSRRPHFKMKPKSSIFHSRVPNTNLPIKRPSTIKFVEKIRNHDHDSEAPGQRESVYKDYYSSEYYDEDYYDIEGESIIPSPPPTQNLIGSRPIKTVVEKIRLDGQNNFRESSQQIKPGIRKPATTPNRPPFLRASKLPPAPARRPPTKFNIFNRFRRPPQRTRIPPGRIQMGPPKTIMEPPPIHSNRLKAPILELPSNGPLPNEPIVTKERPNLLRPNKNVLSSAVSTINPSSTVHVIASVDEQNKILGTNMITAIVSSSSEKSSFESKEKARYPKIKRPTISIHETPSDLQSSEKSDSDGTEEVAKAAVVKYNKGKLETSVIESSKTRSFTRTFPRIRPTRVSSEISQQENIIVKSTMHRGRPIITRTRVTVEPTRSTTSTPKINVSVSMSTSTETTLEEAANNILEDKKNVINTHRKNITRLSGRKPFIPKRKTNRLNTTRQPKISTAIVTSTAVSVKTKDVTKIENVTTTPISVSKEVISTTTAVVETTSKKTNPTFHTSLKPTTYRPKSIKQNLITTNNDTDDSEYEYYEYYDEYEDHVGPQRNDSEQLLKTTIHSDSNQDIEDRKESKQVKKVEIKNSDFQKPKPEGPRVSQPSRNGTLLVNKFIRQWNRTTISPTKTSNGFGNDRRNTVINIASSVHRQLSSTPPSTRYVTQSETKTTLLTDTETKVVTRSGNIVTQTIFITKTVPPETRVSTIVGSITLVNRLEITPTTVRSTVYSEPTKSPDFNFLDTRKKSSEVIRQYNNIKSTWNKNIEKEKQQQNSVCSTENCPAKFHQMCRSFQNGTRSRCDCKPGYGRMKQNYRCRPSFTYELKMAITSSGKLQPEFKDLENAATETYTNFTDLTTGAINKAFLASDIRRQFLGSELLSVNPDNGFNPVTKLFRPKIHIGFIVKLTTNVTEDRIMNHFLRVLKASNFSIGRTGVLASKNLSDFEAKDFDECDQSDYHDCSPNAFCLNVRGSYSCACKPGFRDRSRKKHKPGRACYEMAGCKRCSYKGNCMNDKYGYPYCECFRWYGGAKCQINLKVLLISVIGIGAILFFLVLFCGVLVCKKSKKPPRERQGSGRFMRYRSPTSQGTLERTAIVNDSGSSDGTQSQIGVRPIARMNHAFTPDSLLLEADNKRTRQLRELREQGNSSRAGHYPGKHYADHREALADRSLTILIPRAKIRPPSRPTSRATNGPGGYGTEIQSEGMTSERKLMAYLEQPYSSERASAALGSKQSTIRRTESRQHRNFSSHESRRLSSAGALVSSGPEVSARGGVRKIATPSVEPPPPPPPPASGFFKDYDKNVSDVRSIDETMRITSKQLYASDASVRTSCYSCKPPSYCAYSESAGHTMGDKDGASTVYTTQGKLFRMHHEDDSSSTTSSQ